MTSATQNRDIIVVGASAGGVAALSALVADLPADLPASVFIAQHMGAGFDSRLPEILTRRGPLRATHPVHGEAIARGHIYVAPPDNHLLVRHGYVHVLRGPKENGHRPSVDALFRTASAAYGARVIGAVLTGYRDCGTAGLLSVKARGGVAVVQDPADASVPDMPRSALAHVAVDHVAPLAEIGPLLARLVREPAPARVARVPSAVMELEGSELGVRVGIACPLCHGSLTEVDVAGYDAFRCHVGHAFSRASLAAAQDEEVERALWAAVRALEESADLARRLADRARGAMRALRGERGGAVAAGGGGPRDPPRARRGPAQRALGGPRGPRRRAGAAVDLRGALSL